MKPAIIFRTSQPKYQFIIKQRQSNKRPHSFAWTGISPRQITLPCALRMKSPPQKDEPLMYHHDDTDLRGRSSPPSRFHDSLSTRSRPLLIVAKLLDLRGNVVPLCCRRRGSSSNLSVGSSSHSRSRSRLAGSSGKRSIGLGTSSGSLGLALLLSFLGVGLFYFTVCQ